MGQSTDLQGRWFMVVEETPGEAARPESYPEDELCRRFPRLVSALGKSRFVATSWVEFQDGGSSVVIYIYPDE